MIDFYFEFASPYGYLASLRIDEIAAKHGRGVAWHPIMLGAAFKLTGAQPLMHTPLKRPYMTHDLPRFARYLGLPFRQPPVMPANSLAASRAVVWLEQDDAERARHLAKTIFCAHWGEGRDIERPEQIADIAEHVGIERETLLEAVADPAIKQRLKDQTQAAIDRGVFGSPFIFIDDEPFWGADRLDQVEAWLTRGGW